MNDPSGEERADDYKVVRLSISWGALSIGSFLLLIALQIFGGRFLHPRLALLVGATLALSAAGLVLGLVGLRFGRSRGAARLGVFLNGVVLVCYFVILPLTYEILRRLG